MQKTALIALILFSLVPIFGYSQIPSGYYSNAIGFTGDTLKDSLNNIIDGHYEFPYTSSSQMDVWDALKLADQDPNNSNNVIGVYSGFSMNGPLEYNSGSGWSREHVWAKSRGNFGTSRGAGTDLHNLMAEDISTNSARNNRNFDLGDTRYIDGSGAYSGTTDSYTSSTRWVWEPRDEVKGDIARVIFYMDVRYEGENGEVDLEVVDSLLSNTDQSPLHGNARILYQWHLADTVSAAERRRNDTIYKYQGNRNPFVDHPEFVQDIYGSRFGTTVNLKQLKQSRKFQIYPNPSDGVIQIESQNMLGQRIQLTNIAGKVLKDLSITNANQSFDLSYLPNGIYFMKIEEEVKKLVIAK